jgi:hypothetical protein
MRRRFVTLSVRLKPLREKLRRYPFNRLLFTSVMVSLARTAPISSIGCGGSEAVKPLG